MPHVILGDEAFPLKRYLMRPYSGKELVYNYRLCRARRMVENVSYPGKNLDDAKRVYNYRLCWARRMVENVFGILTARWRIFRKKITLFLPENVNAVLKATCALHNYMQRGDGHRIGH